jgi:hypothetical protein
MPKKPAPKQSADRKRAQLARDFHKEKPRCQPMFRLTGRERMLITLYRTVSQPARERVGRLLFKAWTNPAACEKKRQLARWKARQRRLLANLNVTVLDELTGKIAETGGAR